MSLKHQLKNRKKTPAISVIIPNWNGIKYLKNCLPSLKKQSFKDFEIIVIDNGSLDGSLEYIQNNFPEIETIALSKNIGFSPAVNLGIKKAKGKYIVLINNDTKVDKDCLHYLFTSAEEKKEVGLIAAKMLQFYNPDLIDSAGDYIDAVGHANNVGMGEREEKYNKEGYIFLVTGGGCLIKREVFDKVGLFDDDYFAYFEDVDLSFRAQLAGFKCYYQPKAKIYHIHKATSDRIKDFTEYLQFRNMTQTIIKDFPIQVIFHDFNWLKIILVNLNTIRYLSGKGYLLSALKAEWFILKNLIALLQKRKKIQSLRVVPSEYILQNIRPKKITLFGLLKEGI